MEFYFENFGKLNVKKETGVNPPEGLFLHVEKFSSKNFFGNGLKLKLAIVWIDPEQDSDLRDREVAYSRGGAFSAQSLL